MDDENDFLTNYKKLATNFKSTLAVADDGDLYVWGKNNIFQNQCKPIPTKMGLIDQYLFYKVVHVTTGMNHSAVILQDQLSILVSQEKEFKSTVSAIVAELAKKLNGSVGIENAFNTFYRQKQKRYISIEEFREFYDSQKLFKNMTYSQEQKGFLVQTTERTNKGLKPNQFEQSFLEHHQINILLFYQQLSMDIRKDYIVLIWGSTANGRLGIDYQQYTQLKILEDNKDKSIEFTSKVLQQSKTMLQVDSQQLPQNEILSPTLMLHEFIKISCGHHHTMAITEEGELFIWGMGSQGCLGTGRIEDIQTPMQLFLDAPNVVDIACGAFHSLALCVGSRCFGWGVNIRGQLGLGNKENQLLPQELTYFKKKKIVAKKIYCGDQHSACVTDQQELYTWGNGDYYRLGHGMLIDETEPKKIEILQDVYVLDVSLGTVHSLCITNEGFVYSWGSSKDGVLGLSNQTKDQMLPSRAGVLTQGFKDTTFYQVAAGTSHSVALALNGQLFSWGSNKNQVLGLKLQGQEGSPIPLRVDWVQDKDASQIFRGKFYNENQTQLQQGPDLKKTTFDAIYPIKQAYQDKKAVSHSCNYKFAALGEKNTFLIDYQGHLFGCGSNQYGLLCKNPAVKQKFKQFLPPKPSELFYEQSFTPIEIGFFKRTIIKYISCAYKHAIAISQKGQGYCWGANSNNQLGLGFGSEYVYTPIRLQGAVEQKKLVMSVCGERFSAILTEQGEIWTFGTSEYGVLGQERKNFYVIPEPRMINDIPQMIFIACSNQSMMSIDNTQKLWVWGNNQYGQLGLSLQREDEEGQEDNKQAMGEEQKKQKQTIQLLKTQLKTLKNAEVYILYAPKQILVRALSGEALIAQVACGLYHSLCLTSMGELLSCGISSAAGHVQAEVDDNQESEGVKKQAKYIDQFSSILDHASKKFKSIACHEQQSLAVTIMGEILAWGSPIHYKVAKFASGEGVKCKVISSIEFVACGTMHSLMLQEKGAAFTWGSSANGRLGLHYNKIKDLTVQEILDPEKIECFMCDAALISKKNQEAEKDKKQQQPSKKKKDRKGKKKGHQKKKSTVEDDQDVSIDDEEILDDTSFHSEEGEGVKVQDKLQKAILRQSQDCEAESLYIQDAEIEKRVQLIFKDTGLQALELADHLTEITNKISQIIDYRAKQLAERNIQKTLLNLKFQVPQFIVKNIQLYECIFSSIYHHPCYMIRMIQANQLNKFQLLKFIKIIYKNELMESNNQSIILTLAIKAFENEFMNAQSQIEYISELRLFKGSSVFLQIYLMFLQKDDKAFKYFNKTAFDLVNEFFFKRVYEFLRGKYCTEDDKEQYKECLSKMKHYFNFHAENTDPTEISMKYHILTDLIAYYVRSIIEMKEKAKVAGEDLISTHVKYLHNCITEIIKKKIMKDELKKITEIISIDQEAQIQIKLKKFQMKLDEKISTFLLHLYFGSVSFFIQDIQEQILQVPEDFRPFLQNDQNLRIVASMLDRFFQNDPMLPNEHNDELNKLIYNKSHNKGSLIAIYEVAEALQGYVQFSVENLNMVELIEESYQLSDRFLQIEIQDIIFLQQFYCSSILDGGLKKINQFFVRGIKDPIFIILRHLDFREIQASLFSTEILKRKVNLKLSVNPLVQISRKTNQFSLFKCENCHILTTSEYISQEKLKQMTKLEVDGWKCKEGHYNSLAVLDCEFKGCSEFITDDALKTSRILKYYYRDKDENIDLLMEIMQNMGQLANGTDMYVYLNQAINSNVVRKNSRLTNIIDNFLQRLMPMMDKQDNQPTLEQIAYFHQNYQIVHSKAIMEIEYRQKHRALQLTYNQLLRQLELTSLDRKVEFQKKIQKLKVDEQILKQSMRIYSNFEPAQAERPKADAYTFLTLANMIQQQVLVSLTFQGRVIQKILKNVKFYIFGQKDGGWAITIVYLQDTLLNLLVPCIKSIYPIELSLFNILIPIQQYLELRRMGKYRTQITFKSQNVEITFNIIKLVELFNSLEARLQQ